MLEAQLPKYVQRLLQTEWCSMQDVCNGDRNICFIFHKFLIIRRKWSNCFNIFYKIVVAGHIHAMYKHSLEERRIIQPGTTPIRRKGGSSQSQRTAVESSATPSLVSFAQERIQGELTQQLFS